MRNAICSNFVSSWTKLKEQILINKCKSVLLTIIRPSLIMWIVFGIALNNICFPCTRTTGVPIRQNSAIVDIGSSVWTKMISYHVLLFTENLEISWLGISAEKSCFQYLRHNTQTSMAAPLDKSLVDCYWFITSQCTKVIYFINNKAKCR